MELGDVARLLKVADADIESFDDRYGVLKVNVRDGGQRIVTSEGVFAMDDHPANAQLRRWPGLGLVGESGPEQVSSSLPEVVAQLAESEPVPDGTAEQVLSWVDGDPERALAAWEGEQLREKPRSTLLAALEKLVSA